MGRLQWTIRLHCSKRKLKASKKTRTKVEARTFATHEAQTGGLKKCNEKETEKEKGKGGSRIKQSEESDLSGGSRGGAIYQSIYQRLVCERCEMR